VRNFVVDLDILATLGGLIVGAPLSPFGFESNDQVTAERDEGISGSIKTLQFASTNRRH
jgi:hypothetical protein